MNMSIRDDEVAALIALLRMRSKGQAWGSIASNVAAEGSALKVLNESEDALFPSPAADSFLQEGVDILSGWVRAGYRFTTVLDPTYPRRLRDIREMPPILFYSGDLRADDDGMSVVGSRKPSEQGLLLAKATAELLVDEGLTVISGLAEGIDSAAHRAALDSGGRTVAFIGTGISRQYPVSNAALQVEIAERGLVLSQFFPDSPPTKSSFPMRNASMSGYGLATIVVEAGEHSGSRIQARLAGEHGRPVILTSRVVESTRWGQALVGTPNVIVVSNLAGMREAIRRVRESPERLNAALAALIAS